MNFGFGVEFSTGVCWFIGVSVAAEIVNCVQNTGSSSCYIRVFKTSEILAPQMFEIILYSEI